MRTMTCRPLGGPCDLQVRGDTTHEQALDAMTGRWKHPVKGMGWYENTERELAELPEG